MKTFDDIGQQVHELAEVANNAHSEVQNIENHALNDPKKAIPLYESVYSDLEYLREQLAQLASDLGHYSVHDSR